MVLNFYRTARSTLGLWLLCSHSYSIFQVIWKDNPREKWQLFHLPFEFESLLKALFFKLIPELYEPNVSHFEKVVTKSMIPQQRFLVLARKKRKIKFLFFQNVKISMLFKKNCCFCIDKNAQRLSKVT